jgi:hypothetical protein
MAHKCIYTPAKTTPASEIQRVQLELAAIKPEKPARAPRVRRPEVVAAERDKHGKVVLSEPRKPGRYQYTLFYWSEGGEFLKSSFYNLTSIQYEALKNAGRLTEKEANELRAAHALPPPWRGEVRYHADSRVYQGPVWEPREVTFPSESYLQPVRIEHETELEQAA